MNQTAPTKHKLRSHSNKNSFKNLSIIARFLGVSEIELSYLPTQRLAMMYGTAARMVGGAI